MRAAPDFKVEFWKLRGLVKAASEHMQICALRERAARINGLGNERVVIARQQHDRHGGGANALRGAIEQSERQSVTIETVACEHHDVCSEALGGAQHSGK